MPMSPWIYLYLIRKDYPTTGVLKLIQVPSFIRFVKNRDQEGLPDYWGIETASAKIQAPLYQQIRKDYPTTGVLKQLCWDHQQSIYPFHQEGLPDYWGIETFFRFQFQVAKVFFIRKDYPTTGVLKHFSNDLLQHITPDLSGRITRLLGY